MESKRRCGVLTGESVGFFTAVHAPKCLKELVMDGRMYCCTGKEDQGGCEKLGHLCCCSTCSE